MFKIGLDEMISIPFGGQENQRKAIYKGLTALIVKHK